MQILVIDDEDSVRGFVVDVLEMAGYDVIAASNGAEGLSLIQKSPADLVITDLIMPGGNGTDLLAELKSTTPGIKTITMSGAECSGNTGSLNAGRTPGTCFRLAKPFSPAQLLDLVGKAISSPV
jgi:DNA-binding NtrC family response regulator